MTNRSTAAQEVRRIRQRGTAKGWGVLRTAREIAVVCQLSPLAAHRLACGWTLTEAVTRLEELRAPAGRRQSALTPQMLNSWERGRVVPSTASLDLLCRLYRSRPDLLGFGMNYLTDPEGGLVPDWADAAPGGFGPPGGLDQILREGAVARARFRGVLMAQRGEVEELERLEQAVEQYESLPIAVLTDQVADLVADAVAMSGLLAGLPPELRERGLRITARLTGLTGLGVFPIGGWGEAEEWFSLAISAAQRTSDRALRAAAAARHALMPAVFGDPRLGLASARAARALCGHGRTSTLIWAYNFEAHALARMGRAGEAERALRSGRVVFDRWRAHVDTDTAAGYSERHQHWFEGRIYTALGDTRRARRALDWTLTLSKPVHGESSPLIRIDQAACLAREQEITEACTLVEDSLSAMPASLRVGLTRYIFTQFLEAVPPKYQHLSRVRDLRENADQLLLPPLEAPLPEGPVTVPRSRP